MTTRKLIAVMIVCAALSSTTSALAQGGPPGGGRGGGPGRGGPPPLPDADQIEAMVQELDQALDLSDAQEEKVSDLYVAHFEAVKKAMSKKQDRAKMEDLRKDLEKDVKALLDDRQKALYEEYLKSRGPESERRRQRK